MKQEDENRFYDLVYDAWRFGRNPDNISADRYMDFRADGYYPEEITLKMILPKIQEQKNESD